MKIEAAALTRLDLMFQRVATVLEELLDRQGVVLDGKVHELLELVRMVEIDDLLVAVVGLGDEVQHDVHDLEEELPRRRVRRIRILVHRVQSWKIGTNLEIPFKAAS